MRLNGSQVFAVAQDPRDADSVWMLRAVNGPSKIRLGHYSAATGKLEEYPYPQPSREVYLQDQSWARLVVLPDRVRMVPLPTGRSRDSTAYEFRLFTHTWTAVALSPSEVDTANRLVEPIYDGFRQVLVEGERIYLVCASGDARVVEYRRGIGRVATYEAPGVQSVPFHFQARSGRVTFEDVETEIRNYPAGIVSHRWWLRHWELDRKHGRFTVVRRRSLVETQVGPLKELMARELPTPLDAASVRTIQTVELAGRTLWVGGDFGLLQYDLPTRAFRLDSPLPR